MVLPTGIDVFFIVYVVKSYEKYKKQEENMLKKNCKLEFESVGNELMVFIKGEIDHYSAVWIRGEIDKRIAEQKPESAVLVLSDIDFMDSSGIGLVMGRYARMQSIGGTLRVKDPSDRVERILRLAGIERIVNIEKEESDDEK